MTPDISDLAAGTAGEHIVCADLLLAGYRAFRAEQVCAYDVAVDVGGRLVRIQVKSTRAVKPVPQRRAHHRSAYIFHVRRAGKSGKRWYEPDAFDLLALVALDARKIAYMQPGSCGGAVIIRPGNDPAPPPGRGGRRGRLFSDFPFDRALLELLEGGDADVREAAAGRLP